MADTGTGWERNRRTHFDEIVLDYDRIRPEYPDALFEDIMKYSGMGKSKKAIEIGAGTGKATAPFLRAGYGVTAVEIGVNMAEFLDVRPQGVAGKRQGGSVRGSKGSCTKARRALQGGLCFSVVYGEKIVGLSAPKSQ